MLFQNIFILHDWSVGSSFGFCAIICSSRTKQIETIKITFSAFRFWFSWNFRSHRQCTRRDQAVFIILRLYRLPHRLSQVSINSFFLIEIVLKRSNRILWRYSLFLSPLPMQIIQVLLFFLFEIDLSLIRLTFTERYSELISLTLSKFELVTVSVKCFIIVSVKVLLFNVVWCYFLLKSLIDFLLKLQYFRFTQLKSLLFLGFLNS